MYEYASVSASSDDPGALAIALTDRSADGWEVVAIVPTAGAVTAFVRRSGEASSALASDADVESTTSVWEPGPSPAVLAADATPEPISEPAGWASAPTAVPAAADDTTSDVTAAQPTTNIETGTPYQAAAPAASPSVPAGWYADPAGRFDLRYWDGAQWTEHVARGGQQYTDPPVA